MYSFLNVENDISFVRNSLRENYFSNPRHNIKSRGYSFSSHYDTTELANTLGFLYHEKELGYKILVKLINLNECTYTSLRTIFQKLSIEGRKGNSIVTSTLKKMRSEKVMGTNSPWYDWPKRKPDMQKASKRYLGGFYFNKSKKKWVYLRSSWEYAYANWLDTNLYVWDVEVCSFLLSNGEYYRPDFFVNDKDSLVVVEIKAKYLDTKSTRIDKFNLFRKEYPNITSKIMFQKDIFDDLNINYKKNIEDWKNVRRTKDELTN